MGLQFPLIGPLKIKMNPLISAFQAFEGSKRPFPFDAQRQPCIVLYVPYFPETYALVVNQNLISGSIDKTYVFVLIIIIQCFLVTRQFLYKKS